MKSFSPEDLYRHRVLAGLEGSPAHAQLVFKVTRALRGKETYESTLWGLEPGAIAEPRQLTAPGFSATTPVFDAAGDRLAFLSAREDDTRQVHVLRSDGGEALPLTTTEHALSSIEAWSRGGSRLLVTASVEYSERPEEGDGDARKRSRNGGSERPHVARFLPYKRDGSGVVVGERTQLFDVDTDSGKLRRLIGGDFNVNSAAWSPDDRRLAYIRTRGGRQRHWTELWLADADGRHPRPRVQTHASIHGARWSPDGRRLAFAGSQREGDSMVQLWLVDADDDAPPRRLGGSDFELTPESQVIWDSDGRRLAVVAAQRGLQQLAIVDVDSGAVRLLGRGLRHALGVAAWKDRLAFTVASMRWAEEVHSVAWDGSDEQRHTAFNRKWFARRSRPHVRKRRFRVPDESGGTEKIDAWLLLPPDREPPYPLLVDFHGGPHSHVLIDYAMHTAWYPLLSQGWAVLAPNAVGSGGYGVAFAKRLCGHWGERDLPQILAIVDRLQRQGLVDERLVCTGKSYGGYLSAWAIGNTDRFRAAIVAAPVSNIESHAGTSDTGYYVTPYAMGGELSATRARCAALSPVQHCVRATTATLILQGEQDGRCPVGQAEELFANLIRCTDVPAELVVYPGASHGLAESGKPSHRVDYHQRLCDWATHHGAEADVTAQVPTRPRRVAADTRASAH